MHWLLSIRDNQGRAVNFLHDSFGAMGYLQFNIVNNSTGNAVALDSTDDTYDSGYFANGLEYQFRPQATTSRGNLATRITKGFQQTLSNGVVGQVLCSNTYAYDNACNRISNTVSTAAVNGSGAVQYSGGAPSYGGVFDFRVGEHNHEDIIHLYACLSNVCPISCYRGNRDTHSRADTAL